MTTELMAMNTAIDNVTKTLTNMLESQSSLWNSYVDPKEAYIGDDGKFWNEIGVGFAPAQDAPFRSTQDLFQIQSIGRYFWRENEWAINGHKNRINYLIGEGHVYTVVGKTGDESHDVISKVQDVLDDILKVNKWKRRQKETKLRDDRDGETLIRIFKMDDGLTRFRFIEPRSVIPPNNASQNETFGIRTDPDDIETVEAYRVNGEWVDAEEIQHRKHRVDSSVKRGMPLFYPVRKNLVRASKLLENMSVATEIQTAIALIRRHQKTTQQAVRSFVTRQAEQALKKNGKTENVFHYDPGSIVDVPAGQEYDIPPQLDPKKTVAALQAELRAVASCLVMPEFMLTSDASNANFSSTMVAEGPAVKNFESEQDDQIEDDLELLDIALDHASESGLITPEERNAVKIEVEPPNAKVRDRLQEAQVRQIDIGLGILSEQSASAQAGLDYEQEQTNKESHQERSGALPGLPNDISKVEPDRIDD